eukprot:4341507-Pyramimonas_sp.AAC.1
MKLLPPTPKAHSSPVGPRPEPTYGRPDPPRDIIWDWGPSALATRRWAFGALVARGGGAPPTGRRNAGGGLRASGNKVVLSSRWKAARGSLCAVGQP